MAVMMGALLIHGVAPGTAADERQPGHLLGARRQLLDRQLLLLALNIPLIGLWVRVLKIPYRFLYPAIVCPALI